MSESRPGRPRSPEATGSILDSAAELLGESGVEEFTIRAVVARSGVSSATVYRRWPSKADLLLATAMHVMSVEIPEPPHDTLAGDLEQIVAGLVRLLTETSVGAALPFIVQAAHSSPELADAVTSWLSGRRALVEAALRHGIERGEARADLDVAHGAELLSGPVYYRFLVTRDVLDDEFVTTHARSLVDWAATRRPRATRLS